MLDTLNRYIQGSPGSSRPGLQDWSPGAGLDHRWPAVLTLSILGHILFYVSIISLDWWVYHIINPRHAAQPEPAVKVTMLAPSEGDGSPLRAPPEAFVPIDPRHMKFEVGPDDTRLLPRSSSPGSSTTPATRQAGKGSGSGEDARPAGQPAEPAVASDRTKPQLPASRSIQAPEASSPERTTPATLPVSPASQPPALPAPPAPNEKQRAGHEGGESGDSPGRSNRIGLNAAQSNYIAYVRQKIWRINEKIEPRGFVESVLSAEVVAVFSLIVDRGGRVRTIRLDQSCGHKTLDKIAQQAISLAEPFEGYPPELPDTFEMTVWVRYH